MPTEPPMHPRVVYTPEALTACEKALRTILTKVGPWGQRLVLIGGMTPRYLVGQLPVDVKEHIGTTDLVVWTLSAYKDGPRSVVQEIAKSPVLGHPDVAAAMERLRTHFQTPDHRGPSQYANFELIGEDEDDRARLRRYAHGAVADFFRHWKELSLPG